jgi:hypothetical protein
LTSKKISSHCLLILDIEGPYSPRGLDLESNIPKVAAAWCVCRPERRKKYRGKTCAAQREERRMEEEPRRDSES